MKQRKQLIEHIVHAADLPGEPIPRRPLLEIVGERRVLIENHFGIIQYSKQEICVKVSYGHISIKGSNLEIARMTKEQLVVTGTIDCVHLCRGGR